MLALGELGLLLRRLRADADERRAVARELVARVAEGAALRRAAARARDVVPAVEQRLARHARARVDVDDEPLLRRLGEVELAAQRRGQGDGAAPRSRAGGRRRRRRSGTGRSSGRLVQSLLMAVILAYGRHVSGGSAFEFLIAGGGSAGCVLAARLSEAGRRVCLIEAGPDYGPYDDGRWPRDILDARQLAFSHAWETEREDRSQLRARIMGGCSAHNACVVLARRAGRLRRVGRGLEPRGHRAVPRARRARAARAPFADEELSPWHRAFARAAGADAIVHPVNDVGAVRWNAAFAYLDPARGRENLTIRADTLVDRVLFSGDRAVGVATSAGDVHADHVVLAAGAYGSPGILLRSDAPRCASCRSARG